MNRLQDIKLGVYEKAIPLQYSWPKKFQIAGEAGFDFIELSIDGVHPRIERLNWRQEELSQIRCAAEDAGMQFYTMALSANRFFPLGDDRKDIREQGKHIVRRAIDIASFLGVKIIQLAPYDVNGRESTSQTVQNFRDSLWELTDYAALNGIILTIEVMADVPFITSIKDASNIIREFNSPYLQIYADTGNVAATGADPVSDLENLNRHVLAIHIKDGFLGCCRNVPYGKGNVDFERCFEKLSCLNYRGFFVSEMWCNEDDAFIPYLKTAADFIRSKIKMADDKWSG